jgi:hypothetical protein
VLVKHNQQDGNVENLPFGLQAKEAYRRHSVGLLRAENPLLGVLNGASCESPLSLRDTHRSPEKTAWNIDWNLRKNRMCTISVGQLTGNGLKTGKRVSNEVLFHEVAT